MAVPVININTTGAKGLTNVTTAESTTNFAGFRHSGGGSPSPQDETNVFVQGTQAVSAKVSGSTRDEGVWFTNVGGVDLTTDANKHVFVWAAMVDMSQTASIASGGLFIIVGSSTADWNKYYVSGSDFLTDGRFVRYVIDVTKRPSETAATAATLTAITHIGVGVKGTITAKAENLAIDRIDYGTGLQIEAGDATDPANWQALFDDDNNISNKYGVIQREANGTFTLAGGVTIGDPAGTVTTLWEETSGQVVKFKNSLYHTGDPITTPVSAIDAAVLYGLEVLGNGTGTTDVTFGELIGTGDDRQGLSGGLIGTDGPKWTWDSETDITDLDTVNFYGVQIQGAGSCAFDSVTKTEIVGCTFTNCDEVQPNLADWVNNTVAAPVPDRGLEVVASTNVQQTTLVSGITGPSDTREAARVWTVTVAPTPDDFDERTDTFNDGTTAQAFPTTEAVGDYFTIGSDKVFAGLNINTSTARVGGTLVWEYWDGSAWSALTLFQDDTNTLSTTGNQLVRWNIPAAAVSWDATSLIGESPLFYVRLRVTATMTTNPLLDGGSITRMEEHLLHYPVAGEEDADALVCFGGATHVENSDGATTEDSYVFSNNNVTAALGAATVIGRGQSFTGAGGVLSSVLVQMYKAASTDVADITCRIYEHSGTFGTSGVPTGAALAVSNTVSTTELSELDLRIVAFEFEDEFTLVNTTKYCVTWEVASLFASGQINVGTDNSAPSHAGNAMFLVGAVWTSSTARDYGFFVNSGAILKLSLINGSVIDTDEQNNPLPGATILVNNLSITFTDLIVNSEVRVYLAGTGTEIAGIESTVGSTFAFSVASGVSVDYVIMGPIVGQLAYVPIRQESISWTANTAVVINQQVEPNFNDP